MLTLLSVAWADPAREPWDVVDVPRIARTSGVQVAQSWVGGPTARWFADVVAGTTPIQTTGGRVGLATNVGLGTLLVAVPDEDRAAVVARPLTVEARAWFAGKRPATLHAVGARTALPMSAAQTYLWAIDDAGLLVGVDYVGNVDLEGFDVRVAVGAGIGSLALIDGHAALAAVVEATPAVAVVVGANAGVGPLWARVGARWRPIEGLEAGLDLAAPLTTPVEWGNVPEGEWPVLPTLTVRGFARGSPADPR